MPSHWQDVELGFDEAAERIIQAHAKDGAAQDLPIGDVKTWAIAPLDGEFALVPLARHHEPKPLRSTAFGNPPSRPAGGPAKVYPSTTTTATGTASIFTEANNLPVHEVADWLGLLQDGHPVCPGCGTTGDSRVAFVGCGLKCLRSRCSQIGRAGFRTNIDLVMEVRGVDALGAARLLAEQFGSTPPSAVGASPASVGWGELIPIDTEANLPPFPFWALGPVLMEFVDETAIATQTPEDLAGMLVLAVLAVALGRKFVAVIREGWVEALSLWVLVSLSPASRKSAVFAAVTRPVVEYEAMLADSSRDLIASAEAERARLELVVKKAIAEAEDDATKWPDVAKAKMELAQHVVPASPRLLMDDSRSRSWVSVSRVRSTRSGFSRPRAACSTPSGATRTALCSSTCFCRRTRPG
jgi:hypothetical protein